MTTTTTAAPFIISTPEGPGTVELYYAGASGAPHVVMRMPCAYSDGIDGIGSGAVLSLSDARHVAAGIERLCDTVQPLDTDAWAGICAGTGSTIEELAAEAGLDLDTAAQEDSRRLAASVGERLAAGRPKA